MIKTEMIIVGIPLLILHLPRADVAGETLNDLIDLVTVLTEEFEDAVGL
jgi:hypothetical protein